jgi:hypothetical protein
MIKKTYISPTICITVVQATGFLCNSGVESDSEDIDISYGGVDEEGTLTPGSRRYQDPWYDEEEEEEEEKF